MPRRWAMLALLLAGPAAAQMPAVPGPQPGHGYGQETDPNGLPYTHPVVDQGVMTFTPIPVGITSTPVLAAPATSPRTKLYLLNPSGRTAGTSPIDVWCQYGGTAAIGQGFILMGYGDRVTEDMAATIDQRPIVCIAPSPVVINVGAVQQ